MSHKAHLECLEQAILANRIEDLQDLGDSAYLALLFELCLGQRLKAGASQVAFPAKLLRLASRAALLGLIKLHRLILLRRTLQRLAKDLENVGIDHPWWEPLDDPSPLEQQWLILDNSFKRLESDEVARLRDEALPVLVRSQFLPMAFLEQVSREFQFAVASNALILERAGVGADQRISDQRTDITAYIHGLEPELLAVAPSLCLLVQWLRARLPQAIKGALDQPVYAPTTVMLARYSAPSAGYAPHMDNASGKADNGRRMTLTMYLNASDQPCRGGRLAVWNRGDRTNTPAALYVQPEPGLAVLFPSADVPHQVEPLQAGPARWSLAMWMNDLPQEPMLVQPPRLELADILPQWQPLPLKPSQIAFHRLGLEVESGDICIAQESDVAVSIGLVTTLYAAGADVLNFCDHHLSAGIAHIYLIYDHGEEPEEADWMARVAEIFAGSVTLFSGAEMAKHYTSLKADPRLRSVHKVASHGGASQAVAARQTLNASLVLQWIQAERVASVDWLIHLDADERLCPLNAERGGDHLQKSFAAAQALGWNRLRFLNHERLSHPEMEVYKINPLLAIARLGRRGWREVVQLLGLDQDGPRPWFHAYHNGKSAVRVRDAKLAAGVHGWYLKEGVEARCATLAGPVVLHQLFHDPDYFVTKYRAIAANPVPDDLRLFEPAPLERRLMAVLESAENPRETLLQAYRSLTHFEPAEMDLLSQAGLLFSRPSD